MKYQLTESKTTAPPLATLRTLWPLVRDQRQHLLAASGALLGSALFNLSGPALAGYAIDRYVATGNESKTLQMCALLVLLYSLASLCQYAQTLWMGGVGQHLLFRLRKMLFDKIQQLPLAFFQANRAGDLISRLNSDTDRVNSFFTQSLMQFLGSLLGMSGAAVFLFFLSPRLGLVALWPALLLLTLTRVFSPWVRSRNRASLQSVGNLSAEVSDHLEHFKAIVAYQRRDYFRQRFAQANQENYRRALRSSLANQLFAPLYGLCSQLAQLSVLVYGLSLVGRGEITVGLLISFFTYVTRFYDPVRQLAALWSGFQTAMAGWERISAILQLESNLTTLPDPRPPADTVMEFRSVDFGYDPERLVLSQVELSLEAGKTYALVGPTGGGKTTTASLMARLYDPTHGQVLLHGRDLRSYSDSERCQKVGFILQDPFLLAGTVRDNLSYANPHYRDHEVELLGGLGLDTPVDSLSLGQRQIVAFLRAVLRRPELLILDEATANIDTVTEALLARILEKLPAMTTRVVIAHRLNTIANADEIYFVNQGRVIRAGSMAQAVAMLRQS